MTTSSILEQYALNGKLILVTGASAGIGRVVAYHISALGGRVIISGRNENRLSETLQSLHGSGHKMIVADLVQKDDV
jgi:short-subunit dehydrogenase involved in D-alanine esterification of teichoic acids